MGLVKVFIVHLYSSPSTSPWELIPLSDRIRYATTSTMAAASTCAGSSSTDGPAVKSTDIACSVYIKLFNLHASAISVKHKSMMIKKRTTSIRFTSLLIVVLGVVAVHGCGESHGGEADFARVRSKRQAAVDDRKACNEGDEQPAVRVDTTSRLESLRREMNNAGVDAFLVPSGDSHQSEYIAPADKRLKWISGFSGSSGFAVVTKDKAALWTDGRYFLQAEDQLDCNWLFMKGQEGGDSGWIQWLSEVLPSGSKIGADPTLTGAFTWLNWQEELDNLQLDPLRDNLIDLVWEDRPERDADPLEIQPLKYAGRTWEEKIEELRGEMRSNNDDAIVITALDEIAWLFNLRGKDIPYSPVFRAYAVVSLNKIVLFLPKDKQTQEVMKHLHAENCNDRNCVEIMDYNAIFDNLASMSQSWNSVILGKKWAYSGGASFAIYRLIPEDKLRFEPSPVMLMKARKNQVEIDGMKQANIRDAVAVIEMATLLEDGMANGEEWSELKVSKKLTELRSQQKYYKGDSFQTIAAYGPNGAIIHYKPSEETNTKLGTDSLFLLDSGGQYLDGTTDVTRTFHYGKPTDFEKEAYTRVLMGSIDLARAVFMKGTPDTRMDILARWHLHKVGLNYRHGTGHGIGAYGLIHESPIQVRVYAKEEHPFEVGHFFSDEPGYYQPGEFGIRLETVLTVVEKNNLKFQNKDDYGTFLGYESVCLVPFEPKLIKYELLNEDQVDWLNRYSKTIRDKVGPELKAQGKTRAHEWMMERTEPITLPRANSASKAMAMSTLSLFLAFVVSNVLMH